MTATITTKVCDAICGAGKTQACINLMNSDLEHQYIFITPYLKEVERIKDNCSIRNFISPERAFANGYSKLEDIHSLLRKKKNIASTHALFSSYTTETIDLIKQGNYVLVLDETLDLFQQADVDKEDLAYLLKNKTAVKYGDCIRWKDEEYNGSVFRDLKNMSKSKNLIDFGGQLYFWKMPIDVFTAFTDSYILTYMFEHQLLRYYFLANGVNYELIGTKKVDGKYQYCKLEEMDRRKDLRDKIHVATCNKYNKVGDDKYALSSSWFERAAAEDRQLKVANLKNGIYNFFRNAKCKNADKMWTTTKKYKELIKGKGYCKSFVSFNARATNEYDNKLYLAFCLNVYPQPWKLNYLLKIGAGNINKDMYALSILIQWVFRSAIRKGEEIWIYIPSRRMRHIFLEWLDNLAEGKDLKEIKYD